jgi:cbb3-type cytochrome oxidase subunit 3
MKRNDVLFIFALILLLLAGTFFAIESHEQEIAKENARIANETREQMEYIQSLQAESESIFAQDQDVQDLLSEKTHFKAYEIIHNDNLVEYIYLIGFHPQKLKYAKGFKMVGGTVYRFYINPENNKVIIEEDKIHEDFNPGSGLLVVNSNTHKEGRGISLDSSMPVLTYPGAWLSAYQLWNYGFKIQGREDIDQTSDSFVNHKIQYRLEVKNTVGVENYYLGYDTTGNKNVDVLSGNNSVSSKYWKDERKNEAHTLTISYPVKNSYPVDYFYIWYSSGDANQTIAFDIDMTVKGLGNTGEPEKLHEWRIIIETPPSLDDMSEEDMMELGIWSTTDYGNYYPLSTTVVKKGEWLEQA